ncbi:unnamed protein product [Staurois parvus]|uniref:Uncharacterized protein n=1 Tax=Staurois parvus TaxID=386267 RepID=A0ABN9BE15_9NEOB|nr:unnamed protein product [Staurois parvus]
MDGAIFMGDGTPDSSARSAMTPQRPPTAADRAASATAVRPASPDWTKESVPTRSGARSPGSEAQPYHCPARCLPTSPSSWLAVCL